MGIVVVSDIPTMAEGSQLGRRATGCDLVV